jgi:hypothetical protein
VAFDVVQDQLAGRTRPYPPTAGYFKSPSEFGSRGVTPIGIPIVFICSTNSG